MGRSARRRRRPGCRHRRRPGSAFRPPSTARLDANPARSRPRIPGEQTSWRPCAADPVPAWPEERSEDEVCITSARADGRPGRYRNTRSNALPEPRQVGCAGARPGGGRGRGGPRSASASASTDASPVVGHVYVNDNTKGTNTIGAFDRHADGTLTPEAGSPFAAGGAGTGAGLASQGALQFSADGRFLIAVDAGSNQISVLRIRPDGSLRLVSHGVVSSGGTLPDSVAVFGDLVYVANSGAGSNYTGFRLRPNGRLDPIPGSTVTLAADAAPGDVLFNGTGTKLVGTEVGPSLIDSFTVGFGRAADRRPRIAVPGPGPGPVRQRVQPDQPGSAVRVQRPQHRHRTAAPSRRSPTPRTARCPRSEAPRSRTTRSPRAGWRSAMTASSCSP